MVQNLRSRLNPRLSQAAAYPGSGDLGWAYPSRGLSWTWKCSYKCNLTLSAACWSRERLLRMLFFELYPRLSRPRDARHSGRKMTCWTREPEISSKLYLIHRRKFSFKPLDWSLTNFWSRFPHKFRNSPNTNLDRYVNFFHTGIFCNSTVSGAENVWKNWNFLKTDHGLLCTPALVYSVSLN